jgi:hypothetical protein
VTLQTRAPENFRSRRWEAERRVSCALPGSEDPHRREWNLYPTSVKQVQSRGYEVEHIGAGEGIYLSLLARGGNLPEVSSYQVQYK